MRLTPPKKIVWYLSILLWFIGVILYFGTKYDLYGALVLALAGLISILSALEGI